MTTTPRNMTTEADKPTTLHTQPVDIDNKQEDLTSFVKDLSPTSQSKAVLLLQSIRRNEAVIGEDNKGRPVIQYKDEKSKKIWWDASNANKLTQPKSDDDMQLKMDSCLELIDYLKENKPPSGLVLDPTHVQPKGGQYREGIDFTRTKAVLGTGNTAGDIIVVKDKKTEKESAHKTIMISEFRKEEVRAWIDLNETGIPPAMYCFKLVGNRVQIFMEKIDNGVTLRDIIDTHMCNIRTQDPDLVRPFSLYVFHGLLSAVHTMHQKGWTHRDLHAGNIMLQESPDGIIKTRILDFGLAKPLNSEDGLRGFRTDMAEVVRKFTSLYVSQEFDSETDMKKNWEDKIGEMADIFSLSTEDRSELFCLVDSALQVASLSEVPKLQDEIAAKMNFDTRSLSMKVAKILFPKPDDFQSIHPDSTGDGNTCTAKSDQNDGAQSLQDLNVELQKIKQVMGPSIKTTESSMDAADSSDLVPCKDDYFTWKEIDDTFLDNLRQQIGIGL